MLLALACVSHMVGCCEPLCWILIYLVFHWSNETKISRVAQCFFSLPMLRPDHADCILYVLRARRRKPVRFLCSGTVVPTNFFCALQRLASTSKHAIPVFLHGLLSPISDNALFFGTEGWQAFSSHCQVVSRNGSPNPH